jgi:integrase
MIKVRKRVPSVLIPVINRKEIKKVFKLQADVDSFNALLNECTTIMNSDLPNEITIPIVLEKGLKQYVLQPTNTQSKPNTLEDITNLYLSYSKENVTKLEYNNRVYFYTILLPAIFRKHKLSIDTLKPTDMELIRKTLYNLPSKKFSKYRKLSADELVKVKTPVDERQHIETVNKLIKRVKSLALYGKSTGLFSMPTNIKTYKVEYKDKGNREPFTVEEYKELKEKLPAKASMLLDIVYYSGIRPSEISKCSIDKINGYMVFNLRDSKERLKTSSAYRVIPMHPKLLDYIDEIKRLKYATVRHLSRYISKYSNKTLYSARHSFITNLIKNNVPVERVGELVGHSQGSITMGVYFGGYEIPQLYKDICTIQ